MAPKTADATTAITDAFVAGIKQSQDLAVTSFNAWAEFAGKNFTMPSLDTAPFVDALPKPKDVLDVTYGFAEEFLATQKDFAYKLVDAIAVKA